ncbi:Clp protease ClpP [Pseudomonas guariconensis]|uniref:head maturation protease, ClpP-related n=1 Tax=Pseudomonas guariconensis TaxID=1288410 RepID=UPI0018ABD812|nr:head maturation protease, ClpP-related [Pseudomonas guariconensis]MBF8728859.1 Clp protease ClpP [Pseudomonas guariconensis]
MNLIQLFQNNQAAKREFRIVNEAREATIYLYDIIGDDWYGGVSAKDFVPKLAALDADTIHLRINSPGGDVFEARAMAQAIKQHPARVIAHIDGQAVSAATYVAIAADEVEAADGSFFMIHNAWTIQMGNAKDFRDQADLLDKVDASISADYERKTGKSAEEILAMMAATTWMTSAEALAAGFVDRIAEGKSATQNHWNLAAYGNAPQALTERPEPTVDREALERRLSLLEQIAP